MCGERDKNSPRGKEGGGAATKKVIVNYCKVENKKARERFIGHGQVGAREGKRLGGGMPGPSVPQGV